MWQTMLADADWMVCVCACVLYRFGHKALSVGVQQLQHAVTASDIGCNYYPSLQGCCSVIVLKQIWSTHSS